MFRAVLRRALATLLKARLLITAGMMSDRERPGNPFSWGLRCFRRNGWNNVPCRHSRHLTFSLSVRAALLWLAGLIEYEGPL
jgi:hypothetical protein